MQFQCLNKSLTRDTNFEVHLESAVQNKADHSNDGWQKWYPEFHFHSHRDFPINAKLNLAYHTLFWFSVLSTIATTFEHVEMLYRLACKRVENLFPWITVWYRVDVWSRNSHSLRLLYDFGYWFNRKNNSVRYGMKCTSNFLMPAVCCCTAYCTRCWRCICIKSLV